MFGSAILEVAIGLIFIYTLLSLAASVLKESLSQLFDLRASMLKEGIARLLLDPQLRERFYEHPLIRSLERRKAGGRVAHPAYIPRETFTTVIFDIADLLARESEKSAPSAEAAPSRAQTTPEAAFDHITRIVDELPSSDFKTALQAFLKTSEESVERFKESVENWFDDTMDRVSAWYRQRAQLIVFSVALLLVAVGNIDTVHLADQLWSQPTIREGLVALAQGSTTALASIDASSSDAQVLKEQIAALERIQGEVSSLQLAIGWRGEFPRTAPEILLKIFGLLLTVFAISLGAPFWFDVLKNAVRLSGTVREKLQTKVPGS